MRFPSSIPRSARAAAAALVALCGAAPAAAVDLSTAPLFTISAVKPNIMFLMDDSGSMKRAFLPDQSTAWPYAHQYGFSSTQCNHMAFNPAVTYTPPMRADGTREPDADLSGFGAPSYYVYKGTQPKMGFAWRPDGSVDWNLFYGECVSTIGDAASHGFKVFDEVKLNSAHAQAQNYANWKRFYSTRKDMARTAIKQVFARLDGNYRVGFSITSSDSAVDDSSASGWPRWYNDGDFLDVRDFDAVQKDKFFRAIDAHATDADTPLRGALAKTGQYFARTAKGQTYDPVQRSCQRNYAILATDGGWTAAGEGTGFGPLSLDRSTPVGQQDTGSGVARPMRDAGGDALPSLADVAAYYYGTDLRTPELLNCTGALGGDVCDNDVPSQAGDAYQSYGDTAKWQHLTLFTLGLGLNGNIRYREDYTTARAGDFHDIVTGVRNWPALADPGSKNDYMPLSHTDDMWHAAVNARGRHFSATDPGSMVRSLSTALDLVRASTGAGASASTSSLQPVAGDNDVFLAQFTSQKWTGDVLAFKIDPDTGAVSTAPTWSAKAELDRATVTSTSRRILYRKPGGGPGAPLRDFTAANLAEDSLATLFSNFCSKPGAGVASQPEQCGSLTGATLVAANSADNLVDYLRGNQSLPYYRSRESRLGDIINASPVFVGKPRFPYVESSYLDFKKDNEGRAGVVLAAANDGMLHAFDRSTGRELWAYVPTFVMDRMYKLADTNYPNNHAYLVDGSPQVADIKVGSAWKTIVIGGLNAGGRGYYALDITDPAHPKSMWEYSEDDLGYTFGNPVVVQRSNAAKDWVVVFGAGYNNVSPGDGQGHLYVLDAATGSLVKKISATAPSAGIAKINPWVQNETENVARRFYGGDLHGNVWRFDIDDQVEPAGDEAFLLAQLRSDGGAEQPVTTRPALAELKINGGIYPVVYVATGRYLGSPDVADGSQQTVYALKDPLTADSLGAVRSRADIVEQTAAVTTGADGRKGRVVNADPVDWATKAGWYMDLPGTGERVTVDPLIALDRLYVAANVPTPDTCQVGGSSYLYTLNLATGKGASTWESSTLILGFTLSRRKNGSLDSYLTGANGDLTQLPGEPPASSSGLRRVSWRELVD